MRLVCGVLSEAKGSENEATIRARNLTISWLRWSYFGNIIEGTGIDEILERAAGEGYDICFIEAAGHILPDQWNPKRDETMEFFRAMELSIAGKDFLVAGELTAGADGRQGLRSRWLVVNLARYVAFGRPGFAGNVEGANFVEASAQHGLPVLTLDTISSRLMLDLGPDLNENRGFLEGLAERSERAVRGVFPWNLESYEDVVTPPDDWQPPVSVLYSVAAGLKPNIILATHGFNEETEIVFFDYSDYALAFQKLLYDEWDGSDYPHFLKFARRRLPPDTSYYLWSGASLDDADGPEMQALWQREIDRWGGADKLHDYWQKARRLKRSYLLCNLMTEPEVLFEQITDRPRSVIWWSNSYQTAYSACNYTIEEKRALYEAWINGLVAKAPGLLLYGSDHSNSSVNGMYAAEYLTAYEAVGGDPLIERKLHRHRIRF